MNFMFNPLSLITPVTAEYACFRVDATGEITSC